MRLHTLVAALLALALLPGPRALDGQPHRPALDSAPSATWTPSAAQVAWLRARAVPLRTTSPGAPSDDLHALGRLVGDAAVVGLGEATHGTREFSHLKHRIVEYLAREHGFTLLAIEASMPEARRLNEYVLTGRGDARAALRGMYFWTVNTQEMLDLVEWMRAHNAAGKGRIEFWGFDGQVPTLAMDSVRAFVARADSAYVRTLAREYGIVDSIMALVMSGKPVDAAAFETWRSAAERVVDHLSVGRGRYAIAGRDTLEIAWALQNARIVTQGAHIRLRGVPARDSAMAANVEWILTHQSAPAKLVLWGHNGHIHRRAGWMGAHLADRLGDGYRAVGFATGEGEYSAFGRPGGIAAFVAGPPASGSVEVALRAVGLPLYLLDLRTAARDESGRWLGEERLFRAVGGGPEAFGFYPARVGHEYDALIYVDRSTPADVLPPHRRR